MSGVEGAAPGARPRLPNRLVGGVGFTPMRVMRRPFCFALVIVLLFLAGCTQPAPGPDDGADGGDGTDGADGMDGTDGDGMDGGEDAMGTAVAWREHPFLGSILVDADGMTLYVFTRDEPGTSTCTGGCAAAWPPLTTPADTTPEGPAGLDGRLDTATREDGTTQLTLDDRPLYHYAEDDGPGDAVGQGRGGVWFVVRESDEPGALNVDFLDGPGSFAVTAENVTYHGGVQGHLARPVGDGPFPGVVMVHEWWGLNEHIRTMAEALASHGYAVLAVDLFNGSVATTSDEARAQITALDQDAATANMRAAAQTLRDEAGATAIASLGWCFGGGQSLQLALSGEELAATVLYYGQLVTDESQLAVIEWPVLGVFGAEDGSIPVSQVEAFERALDNASIENEVHVYDGVGHAFANPSNDAYGAPQAMDAWAKTLAFLEASLA